MGRLFGIDTRHQKPPWRWSTKRANHAKVPGGFPNIDTLLPAGAQRIVLVAPNSLRPPDRN
jgi:hypothetical protein